MVLWYKVTALDKLFLKLKCAASTCHCEMPFFYVDSKSHVSQGSNFMVKMCML